MITTGGSIRRSPSKRHVFDASAAPCGQLPYVVDDSEAIGDSDTIIAHLLGVNGRPANLRNAASSSAGHPLGCAMALHRLSPAAGTVHGIFSRERAPVLTIASGDSVVFQTLDAGWGALEQAPGFTVPQAFAPRDLARDVEGLATFGFHRDLNEAWTIAAREMVRLMEELYRLKPKEALSLAGLVAHLSITQAVNGVRGVHAFLPHDALEFT
jgi:acetamidase/formamidase